MKKLLLFIGLIALAGCSSYYDYYKGGVRYTQDGEDCIYYSGESARHYSNSVNAADIDKKIVYRNTRCADLYARDTMGQEPRAERRVLTPAADVVVEPVMEPASVVVKPAPIVKKSCSCCAKKTTKQYVIVSGM